MKRIVLVASVLALGACASTPQMQTRYVLNQEGNLVEQQYYPPSKSACESGSINWCVAAAITAGVLVGVWGLDRIINDSDDDPAPAPATPSNPLIQTGGTATQSWSGDFIQPVYQPL